MIGMIGARWRSGVAAAVLLALFASPSWAKNETLCGGVVVPLTVTSKYSPYVRTGVSGEGGYFQVDTGATITKAAEALFAKGADQVIVTATHGVLSGAAVDELKNSRISEVIVTSTLPIPEEKRFDKLVVLSIAPLIARAIQEVFSDGSVTSLFEGRTT